MADNDILSQIEDHVSAISSLLGLPVTESNKDTPHRVAKMYCNELFANRNDQNLDELKGKMKVFPNEGTTTPITISGVEFCSTCEHHWLPFMGIVSVTYVPDKTIIGLSKIPRVVKYFSRRPQLQERLTNDIGNFLVEVLNPKFLEVKVTATHTCVMCRGAESNCNTSTLFKYCSGDQ